jgi:hypothetical protein
MTNEPADHHVVAAAIFTNTQVIVTTNLDDLPVESSAPYEIETWHPDHFLVYFDEQNPGTTIKIIWKQSNEFKLPRSIPETLDKLENNNLKRKNKVPKFSRSIPCQFYADGIVQTARKTLDRLNMLAAEGGKYYEGKWYGLWQKG